MEIGNYKYVGSVQVDDHRYPAGGKDRVMTTVFVADRLWGAPRASDDIVEIAKFPLEVVAAKLVTEHTPVWKLVLDHFKKEQSRGPK